MRTSSETATILELRKVTVTTGGKKILDNVSLKLQAGNKTLVRGPSGSGKSTLLNVIMGGMPVTSGEVRFLGVPVTAENVQRVRSQISFVGQEPLLGAESAREGLLLPFTFKSHRTSTPSEQRIVQVLSRLGLQASVLSQSVSNLSGGEKQRIALARAMLLNSRLFLLDEVTSALDPETNIRVWRALSAGDLTILAISHHEPEGADFDRTMTMKKGRLTAD